MGSPAQQKDMAHFAEIDENGVVKRVIVAEQDFIDSGAVGNPANWVQTSYNTREGKHKDGGVPLRKNYAGIGYTYDKQRDAFIPPKPHPSWKLNEETCAYEAPVPKPKTGELLAGWDEEKQEWKKVPDKK